MNEGWKRWEGQVVDGKFPLLRFLGGSKGSGVFLVDTSAGGGPQTAIKLVPAASVEVNEQLRQWKVAADLDHPNVVRVLGSGQCELGGAEFLYVLTESAEEDLSQILPERALTAEEARQVLDAVLKGLAYIHGKGLVHGRVKPSNILAAGDVVKLSSDSVRVAGEVKRGQEEKSVYDAPEAGTGNLGPSADIWSLGVTLVEMLTQRLPVQDSERERELLPAGIPQPFQEIAWRCLQVDPGKRWTAAQIAVRLEGKTEVRGPHPPQRESAARAGKPAAAPVPSDRGDETRSAKWPYALAIVVAVAVLVLLFARPKSPSSQTPAKPSSSASSEAAEPATSSIAQSEQTAFEGRVATRVIPEIRPSALHTIRGRIKIQVKLDVDETGNVTQAHLKSSGPSQYFARQSLEAARQWKFKPARANGRAITSQWVVQFILTRRAINDSAILVKP